MNLEQKSGQAYSDPETFTNGHRLDFHSGKTVDQPIPSRKSEDSPRNSSNWREPSEKKGVAILFSRRENALWILSAR